MHVILIKCACLYVSRLKIKGALEIMDYFKGLARNIDGVGDEKADLLDTDPEMTPMHLPLEPDIIKDKSSSKVSCLRL